MKITPDFNISSFKEETVLSDFIHRIGHDIGNPLTSLISLASLLERSNGEISADDSAKYLKAIINDAWRVQGIMERAVLILSAKSEHDNSSTNISEVVQKAIRKVLKKPAYQRFDIFFSPVDAELQIKLSRSSAEWLLVELLSNSLNYLCLWAGEEKEGQDLTVKINVHPVREKKVILEIENPLFPNNNIDSTKLCEPFTKFPENAKGTGLGLTAIYAVVTRAEGQLTFESDDSVFKVSVTLPA